MRTSYRFSQYAKAGLVFAATTATYFFARATGVLPSWFNWEKTEKNGLTVREPMGLADFQIESPDLSFSHHGQHQLLSIPVTIINPIPDQVIEATQLYIYSLNNVFSGDYSLLKITGLESNSQSSDWLTLQYDLAGESIVPGSMQIVDVDLENQIAFMADATGHLVIMNFSNPDVPEIIISYKIPSQPQHIEVQDNYAFIANSGVGLQIINVSDLWSPQLISSYILPNAYVVVLDNNTAFLADYSTGLQIVDVSDLRNPVHLGSYQTLGTTMDVKVYNNVAFISDWSYGLRIVNVTLKKSPALISTYQFNTQNIYDNPIYNVVIQKNIAFLSCQIFGMQIVNVTDPANPILIASYYSSGGVNHVLVSNKVALVSVGGNGLDIVDISNLENPSLISSYATPVSCIAIQNSYVFIIDGLKLQILDLRTGYLTGTPTQSRVGASFSLAVTAMDIDTDIQLANDYFQLTIDQFPQLITSTLLDQTLFPGQSLILTLDSYSVFSSANDAFLRLSVGLNNQLLSPSWLSLSISPLLAARVNIPRPAHDLAVKGSTVFLADSWSGLQVIDITDPNQPGLIGAYNLSPNVNAVAIAITGNTVFMSGSGYLQVIDVTNPSSPVLMSTYNTKNDVRSLFIDNNNIFIGGQADDGIHGYMDVVNINNLKGLYRIATINTTAPIMDMVISNNIAFVVENNASPGNGGLEIINVTDLTQSFLISSFKNFLSTFYIVLQNDYVFALDISQGVEIINVSLLNQPRLISIIPLGSYEEGGLALQGNTLFLTGTSGGNINHLQVIDISNLTFPNLLATYSSSQIFGALSDIVVQGGFAYMPGQPSSGAYSLEIIDVSQWSLTARPTIADVRNYLVEVIATDPLGGSASTSFTIRVEGPPQIHGVIPIQYAKIGQPYHYFVPDGFFTDPNFDPIVFSSNLSSGQKLPAWLSFNSISAAFAGTPLSQDVGSFNVTISATDNIAGAVNTTFQLFVDYVPVLNQPLPSQVAGVNILYQWSLPANTFFDPAGDVLTMIAQLSNGQALPAWLNFNTTTQQFSGMPSAAEDGQYYNLVVIASDAYQGQVQAPFSLAVEYFPRLNLPIAQQLAIVGNIYTLTVPVNTFLDAQDRALTYRVAQANGLTLPNWLGFNARTLVLAGVPQLTDVGVSLLQFIATDPSGGWGQLNFNLTVTYQPVSNQPVSSQLANINSPYQWVFSNDTFTDPLGQSLAYSVQQANGDPLPAWLRFNSALLQLSGIPNSTAVGQYSLNITAKNSAGAVASMTFSLLVEYFPQINRPITSQWVQINQGWTLTLPKDTFLDAENQLLIFKARQANGGSLPNWLSFNPQTQVFSGVAQITDAGKLTIQLTATDSFGGSAQQNFNLTMTQFPLLNDPIPPQIADVDQLYQWTAAPDLFTDPQGRLLTYTAQSTGGGSLPEWLAFNSSQFQLSGRPNRTQVGAYALEVVAVNTDGAITVALFSLIVEYFPQLASLINPQWANINNPFSLTLPANTFVDPEGEPLTYQARQTSGLSLPNWLAFNRQTLVFSGVPQASDVGTVRIQLTATDTQGGAAQQIFNVTATYFPLQSLPVPDQVAGIDLLYQWNIPGRTFTDPLGRALRYAIQSSGGKPLPGWLNFNTSMATLSGEPDSTQAGQYGLKLMAQNVDGAQVMLSFNLRVEYFPRLDQPIIPPLAGVGQPFTFVISPGSFSDPDDEILTYQASRVGGGALPNWLSFNRQGVNFSGVPAQTDESVLPIQLIASDAYGGSAQANFTISVVEVIDTTESLSPPVLRQNRPFTFQVPSTTFSNPGNLTLTYQATRKDGSILPNWLQFNGFNLTFSGTPPLTGLGSVNVIVTAQDPLGIQAAASLSFNIQPNFPPQVQQPISDQSANVGALFSLFIATDTFIDPNGDLLSYSAQQSDGSPLPEWLNFNATHPGFSGIPGHGDTDAYALRRVGVTLRASDGQAQASTTFYINVGGMSYVALAVNIGSPLLSFFTALYALYRERYLFLNCWKPARYQKPQQSAQIGQKFQCTLGVAKEKVYRVQAELPRRVQGRCQFFQASYQSLPAGRRLPSWMEYDPDSNCLRSKGSIPPGSPERLRVQVADSNGIIVEQFELHIRPGASPGIQEMQSDEKDLPSPHSVSSALISSGSLHPLLSSPVIELEEIMPVPDKIDEVEMEDSQSEVGEEESTSDKISTNRHSLQFSSLKQGSVPGSDGKDSQRFCL